MKASVIIPTLNRQKILIDTLENLLEQKEYIEEIILIDQSDQITEEFLTFIKKIPLVKHFRLERKNTPNARNYGIKKAKSEIILFLDDDIIPAKDLIKAHLINFNDSTIDGVTGRVISPKEKGVWTDGKSNIITPRGDIIPNWTSKVRSEVNTVAGGNCSFKKSLIEKAGYFDDSYIGNAMREESDFALRFVRAGYKIVFDPKAEIIHLSYPAGGSRQKTRIEWYYDFFHNEYYFFLKHFSKKYLPFFFLRKLRPILACIFYYGRGSWSAIKTPFLGFAAASRDYKKTAKK